MKKRIVLTDEQYARLLEGSRPEGKKPKGLPIYCPYCDTWTKWTSSEYGYEVTDCCGISSSDFMIKKYNPELWGWSKTRK